MDSTNPLNTTSCHFTYQPVSGNDLQQGDVLSKNSRVQEILKNVHPHYMKDDYTHFIVLTQSCDLVRRNNKPCKARYISLAAVRPLSLLLERELKKGQDEYDYAGKICKKSVKSRLEQFLERLFNNNEPEYFYLHEEPTFNLQERSCAFLRLSVAIRTSDHYETCLDSRLLSLSQVFQAKLGWLVGNMYSRVGTEDWTPINCSKEQFKELIAMTLDELCLWIDDERLRHAKQSSLRELSPQSDMDTIRKSIQEVVVPDKRQLILDSVITVLKELSIVNEKEQLDRISRQLRNDQIFQLYTK